MLSYFYDIVIIFSSGCNCDFLSTGKSISDVTYLVLSGSLFLNRNSIINIYISILSYFIIII